VIRHRGGQAPRVLLPFRGTASEASYRLHSSISIYCSKKDGLGNEHKLFQVHHLLLYVLDPDNCLFDLVHRFTTFRGYWSRKSHAFCRPRDNCMEVKNDLDQDGDGLASVCKTDGEHTLGYMFNSLWSLWKTHHAVNSWMHHIRSRAGCWLHPYIKEKYAEAQEDRAYPAFYKTLPKTLVED
jgi:hypothetical protein